MRKTFKFLPKLGSLSILAFCVSCSLGQMEVRETHYYAVPGEHNTNYYRLNVKAKTILGDAEYRSGFFPSNAVDNLFGDVSAEGGAEALEARRLLERQIRDSLIQVNAKYQERARDPNTTDQELDKLLQARRRILAYPRWRPEVLSDTIEIDYNPSKGIAIRRSDEKLVFILSSNPNEVVGKIANFAESDKTVYSINQFAQVIAQRTRNEIAAQEATEAGNIKVDHLIYEQIEKALSILEDSPTAESKELAIKEIDVLLQLLDNVRR